MRVLCRGGRPPKRPLGGWTEQDQQRGCVSDPRENLFLFSKYSEFVELALNKVPGNLGVLTQRYRPALSWRQSATCAPSLLSCHHRYFHVGRLPIKSETIFLDGGVS
jgi:hypothetical protein